MKADSTHAARRHLPNELTVGQMDGYNSGAVAMITVAMVTAAKSLHRWNNDYDCGLAPV